MHDPGLCRLLSLLLLRRAGENLTSLHMSQMSASYRNPSQSTYLPSFTHQGIPPPHTRARAISPENETGGALRLPPQRIIVGYRGRNPPRTPSPEARPIVRSRQYSGSHPSNTMVPKRGKDAKYNTGSRTRGKSEMTEELQNPVGLDLSRRHRGRDPGVHHAGYSTRGTSQPPPATCRGSGVGRQTGQRPVQHEPQYLDCVSVVNVQGGRMYTHERRMVVNCFVPVSDYPISFQTNIWVLWKLPGPST